MLKWFLLRKIVKRKEELWITNINRFKDIRIGDLGLTIRQGQSLNLLSTKKNGLSSFNLTRAQIDNSISNGSIFRARNYIKVRIVAPQVFTSRVDVAQGLDLSSRRNLRKPPEIEQLEFPDLDLEDGSAEDFAAENADMDAADRSPILAVDPMFKRSTDDE